MFLARIVLVVLLLAAPAGLGAADASAYRQQETALESRWLEYSAQGVPEGSLTPLRNELDTLRGRHFGPVPYSFFSGAIYRNPLKELDAKTDALWLTVKSESRTAAESALSKLQAEATIDKKDVSSEKAQFAAASTPLEYQQLAASFTAETALLAKERQARIEEQKRLAEQERQRRIAEQKKLDAARANAQYYLDQDSNLLLQYRTYGKSGDQQAQQLNSLQAALNAAQTVAQITPFAGKAQTLGSQLNGLIAAAASQPNPAGCLQHVAPKLIVIHLATQQLIAYDRGCVLLRTPVTTGRPALPTFMGTFSIFYKAPRYLMHSPWPPGSPYWYPDTWVAYAMEFIGNGSFIHTADWEPAWAYGPGSQYGAYASHGCVHVLDGPALRLYNWAPIGTQVVVEN